MEDFIKQNWLTLVSLAVQGLWGWAWWSLRKQFVTVESHAECQDKRGKRLGDIENTVGTLKHRVDIVERDVKALPTAQGINALSVEIEAMRGELKGLRAELQGQDSLMKRIDRQLSMLIEHRLAEGHQ